MEPLRLAAQIAFEISPIFFVNGIAKNIPGSILPIVFFTEGLSLSGGLLTGGGGLSYETASVIFKIVPGAILFNAVAASYPFANQTVAANAMINEPLRFSMLMICPARKKSGMLLKNITLSMLKAHFDQHQLSGGYYNVLTPAYMYNGCLLTQIRDVTSQVDNGQVQTTFQLDFEQPLVQIDEAEGAYNQLLSQLSSGCKIPGGLPETNWLQNGQDWAKKWL